jgi:hypothetical protein
VAKDRPDRARRRRDSDSQTVRHADGPFLSWRYRLGRLLQFVGLLILPFGIASELVGRVGLGQSLLIAGAGALLFYVGFLVQHRS